MTLCIIIPQKISLSWKNYCTLLEFSRRWLGYHNTPYTYNFRFFFSEELTFCDLVIDSSRKNCAMCSPAEVPKKIIASQQTIKIDKLLTC